MPSIELICVDQTAALRFQNLSFALESENQLVPHRIPSPLFKADFDDLKGCIYHLGNPALRDPNATGAYTAYKLLSKDSDTDWWEIVHFAPEFVPDIKRLLEELIVASPKGEVIFTSDYQFGPDVKRYKRPLTLDRFWKLHDEKKLEMNALYKLKTSKNPLNL